MVAAERCVELADLAAGFIVTGADDDPVRAHAIGQGTAFLEKLRVGHHPYLQRTFAAALQLFNGGGTDLVRRANRHRGLDDQGAVGLHETGNLPGHVQHMAEVGRTVFIGGRTDGDEDQLGVLYRIAGLGGEEQATGLDVFFKGAGKPRLTDRWHGLLQLPDLVRIDVDTQDTMSDIGQCRCLNQANIARTKYAHVHISVPRKTVESCKTGLSKGV
ncbi:hypothetical protein D3C87_1185790 [compost metagenome]